MLQHAVELKLLARRDPQAAVADRLRQVVAGQILLGREASAHDALTRTMNWKAFSLPSFLSAPRRSRSSCWYEPWNLRIDERVFGEVRLAVFELVGHESLQILAGELRQLDLARLGAGRLLGGLHR